MKHLIKTFVVFQQFIAKKNSLLLPLKMPDDRIPCDSWRHMQCTYWKHVTYLKPSCLQTTLPSSVLQSLSHTHRHSPWWCTCTLPKFLVVSPRSVFSLTPINTAWKIKVKSFLFVSSQYFGFNFSLKFNHLILEMIN